MKYACSFDVIGMHSRYA